MGTFVFEDHDLDGNLGVIFGLALSLEYFAEPTLAQKVLCVFIISSK
jgi:hypothetical protein